MGSFEETYDDDELRSFKPTQLKKLQELHVQLDNKFNEIVELQLANLVTRKAILVFTMKRKAPFSDGQRMPKWRNIPLRPKASFSGY